MHNLNLAFDIAERDLDIPKMLDAEGELFVVGKLAFLDYVHWLVLEEGVVIQICDLFLYSSMSIACWFF